MTTETMTRLESLLPRYGGQVPRYTSYPPATSFTEDVGRQTYAKWLRQFPAGAGLSLYLHVPFCDTLCWFCACHTRVVNRYEPVAAYAETLHGEIALVADEMPGGRVQHLHFGGGSPTILSDEDFSRLMADLRARFRIAPDAEVAIEIDPRDLSAEKIENLAASGINRVSIGVQDFNPDVQQAVNRIQSFEMTRDSIERLRAAAIKGVNIDVIYGLPGQTLASVRDMVEKVVSLAPDRVAAFGYAHVPWMKGHQRLLKEDQLPTPPERLQQCLAVGEEMSRAGYRVLGLDHYALPGDALARAADEGCLHRNFQGYTTDAAGTLIGFGASAIGSLPQGYVQNTPDVPAYRRAIAAGRLATARGVPLSRDDQVRRAVIERIMCDLTVDLAEIAAEHDLPADVFAAELSDIKTLATDGLVEVRGTRITVPPAMRPFMRHVAAAFDAYRSGAGKRHSLAV